MPDRACVSDAEVVAELAQAKRDLDLWYPRVIDGTAAAAKYRELYAEIEKLEELYAESE